MRSKIFIAGGREDDLNATYSSRVKEQLCRKTAFEVGLDSTPTGYMSQRCDKCCALAFFYGVVLFSRRLERETMTLSIENEELLEICTYIMIQHFLAQPDVRVRERGGKKRFEVSFGRELVGKELFDRLSDDERSFDFACSCENCRGNFLRGVFLSAGNISDPKADYRAEIVLKDLDSANALKKFMGAELAPKVSKRRSDYVVYVKGRERLESFCTVIGAELAALDIIVNAIEKDKMNSLNRTCNCDAANIKKTVNASLNVRMAINKLRESGRFELLPDELKRTAELREQYPEASLSDLAVMVDSKISRSGLNHRLKKLIEIAEQSE